MIAWEKDDANRAAAWSFADVRWCLSRIRSNRSRKNNPAFLALEVTDDGDGVLRVCRKKDNESGEDLIEEFEFDSTFEMYRLLRKLAR